MWIVNNSLDVIQMIGRRQFQATSANTWVLLHSISAHHTAFTNCCGKHTRLDNKTSLSLATSVHFGQMRRSLVNIIIFHVEIFAMLHVYIDFLIDNTLVRFSGTSYWNSYSALLLEDSFS